MLEPGFPPGQAPDEQARKRGSSGRFCGIAQVCRLYGRYRIYVDMVSATTRLRPVLQEREPHAMSLAYVRKTYEKLGREEIRVGSGSVLAAFTSVEVPGTTGLAVRFSSS